MISSRIKHTICLAITKSRPYKYITQRDELEFLHYYLEKSGLEGKGYLAVLERYIGFYKIFLTISGLMVISKNRYFRLQEENRELKRLMRLNFGIGSCVGFVLAVICVLLFEVLFS